MILLRKGREIGGVFNTLCRNWLPIGKEVLKSSPKIIESTFTSPLVRKLCTSAQKSCIEYSKKHIDSGDIQKTLKMSMDDSKQEVSTALCSSKSYINKTQNINLYSRPKHINF